MAISLKHSTLATGTDAGNGEIAKAQWNEEHAITMASGKLLGRYSASTGAVQEINVSTGLALDGSGNLTSSSALDINGLTSATPAADDTVPIYDLSATANRKSTASEIAALALGGFGYSTNAYYLPFQYVSSASTIALTANRVYYLPFVVVQKATFTRIGVDVTTGVAASTIRLGIYDVLNGAPNSRLVDAGTVSSASTATVEATISQTLNPGFYCLALISASTPTIRAVSGTATLAWAAQGYDQVPNTANVAITFWHESGSSGSLPATASSLTRNTNTASAPSIWLRVV